MLIKPSVIGDMSP